MKTKKKLRYAAPETPVVKEGVLSKHLGLRGLSPRYVVVRGGEFEYYSDRAAWLDRKEPRGVVELFCCKVETITENTSGRVAIGLTPSESEKKFVFYCANAHDQKLWHEALVNEISKLLPSDFGLRHAEEVEEGGGISVSGSGTSGGSGGGFRGSPESSVKREISDIFFNDMDGRMYESESFISCSSASAFSLNGFSTSSNNNNHCNNNSSSSSAAFSASSSPMNEDPRDLRFSDWVAGHISTRKDVSTLFRAVAKQVTKITAGLVSSASESHFSTCTCACQCCVRAHSESDDGGWTALNTVQLLDEVFKLLDNGVKTSSLQTYLDQRPTVAVQLGLSPASALAPMMLVPNRTGACGGSGAGNNSGGGSSGGSSSSSSASMYRSSSSSIISGNEDGNWLKKKLERRINNNGNSSNGNTNINNKLRFTSAQFKDQPTVKISRQIEYHQIDSSQLRIGQSLGSGATGVVYAGTYFEQHVAVKKLHPHIAAEASAIEDFLQEAEIWKPLTFRNILQLYGVCTDSGNVSMVMEIGAMSLSDLLYKEVKYPDLPWSRRLNIARDIASGCLYLHSKNIVHRDIKTMNILLSQEGIVKLCDFGMSKTLSELEEQDNAAEQLMGTPQWLAPEIAEGESFSKAADVFSFGIVLWEIASRRLPYTTNPGLEDATVNTLVSAIAKGVRPSLHSLQFSTIPQVNDRFMALMIKCWTIPGDARPAFEEIVAELSDILDLEEHRDRAKEREAEIFLRKANDQFNKREYQLALKAIARSTQCHVLAEAYMLSWLSYMSLKQVDDALQVCERWIKDFPFSTAAFIKKGDVLMFQQKFSGALEAFKQAQSLDPYDLVIKKKFKDCQRNLVVDIDLDPTLLVARKVCHRATIFRSNYGSAAPSRAPPPLPPKSSMSSSPSTLSLSEAVASASLSSSSVAAMSSLPSPPPLPHSKSAFGASTSNLFSPSTNFIPAGAHTAVLVSPPAPSRPLVSSTSSLTLVVAAPNSPLSSTLSPSSVQATPSSLSPSTPVRPSSPSSLFSSSSPTLPSSPSSLALPSSPTTPSSSSSFNVISSSPSLSSLPHSISSASCSASGASERRAPPIRGRSPGARSTAFSEAASRFEKARS